VGDDRVAEGRFSRSGGTCIRADRREKEVSSNKWRKEEGELVSKGGKKRLACDEDGVSHVELAGERSKVVRGWSWRRASQIQVGLRPR